MTETISFSGKLKKKKKIKIIRGETIVEIRAGQIELKKV